MRSIFLLLIILGTTGFIIYSGVLNMVNFNDSGFQSVGKISLQGNVSNSLTRDIIGTSSIKSSQTKSSFSAKKSTKSAAIKSATIVAIIATTTTVTAPATTVAATAAPAPITSAPTSSELLVAPVVIPIISPVLNTGHLAISEILAGIDGNADYEFIELYNPTADVIDLTGWFIKKRNSKNNEETLVSAKKFQDKKIMPNKYLLLVNEGGYNGGIQADISWPKSYTLAYANNAVILYNANGEMVEDVGWSEIVKGQSLERVSWNSNEFKIQSNPNPQNSY